MEIDGPPGVTRRGRNEKVGGGKKKNSNQQLIEANVSDQSGFESFHKLQRKVFAPKDPSTSLDFGEKSRGGCGAVGVPAHGKVSCVCITGVVSPRSGPVAFESLSKG